MKDRGKAKYFHGRKAELEIFNDLMAEAEIQKSGTSLLFQGAPGVGKTALLERCQEVAKQRKWIIAEGNADIFWNIKQIRRVLRLGYKIRTGARFGFEIERYFSEII